ncbi:MAG: 16S rRNA (adenine(1518)-N(6)/adenine(1519)-N(6))-dimethyltransferase RsmA [Dehalococcoidia bacterium]|nr:16S rRNA (adenine(1518)-N(6)/adenine(1519)-N(6))-dimethyltransferase RsmA [Dehalococcoidia bacterium]
MEAVHPSRRLKELELAARKGLGQHFLADRGALGKILRAARLSPEDTVVEVGPGLGILTAELLKQVGRVIAVELDEALVRSLCTELAAQNLTIVQGDILKLLPASLLSGVTGGYKVVANLPYYITSAVLRHFLESTRRPELMVVMVQLEVARAITAAPGEMGMLGLSVQIFGAPRIVCRVPAGAFYPPPKVDSAVVGIEVFPAPTVPETELVGFFGIARAAFSAARKQIQNSLAQGLGKDKTWVAARLEAAEIDPRRRAETLEISEWVKLWEVFRLCLP